MTSVALEPMTAAEFDAMKTASIVQYARENVAVGNWPKEEAERLSAVEIDRLLPEGRATPDHFFFTVRAGPAQEIVGHLWFAIRRPPDGSGGFVFEVEIREPHRRKGYGEGTFRALEEFARARGVDRIGLHVFGSNAGAIALYRKLGFDTTGLLMMKKLDRGSA